MITVPVPDNGSEVIWAERRSKDLYQVISVPVFIYGISRGTVLAVQENPDEDALILDRIIESSTGATIRCYVTQECVASRVYLERMVIFATKNGLAFGPATFFDPEVVAIHVHDRTNWKAVGRYCDYLVQKRILKFWELADPDDSGVVDESSSEEPWVVIHQPPGDFRGVPLIRA